MGVGSWGGLHDVAPTRYRRLPLQAVCVNRISMVRSRKVINQSERLYRRSSVQTLLIVESILIFFK